MSSIGQQASSIMDFFARNNEKYLQFLRVGDVTTQRRVRKRGAPKWFEKEDVDAETLKAFEAVKNGASCKMQADKLGISESALRNRFRSRNLVHESKTLNLDEAEIIRLYEDEGLSVNKIAEIMGVSNMPIRLRLKKAGIKTSRGKRARIESPSGKVYEFRGVNDFVKSHKHLFTEDQLKERKNSQGYSFPSAVYGLNRVLCSGKPWKGWRRV